MLLVLFCFTAETALAQVQTYKEMHKVKRKETIFGIARENGLTVQELIDANPEMNSPGYELKKGGLFDRGNRYAYQAPGRGDRYASARDSYRHHAAIA